MSAYSLDMREKIVAAYEAGNTSVRKVAQRFMVSPGVVQRLLNQKRRTGSIAPKPARGGKASQLAGHESEIHQMVQEHPDYTLEDYCEYWERKTGVRLSSSAMCRFLQTQNLTLKKNISQCSSRNRPSARATSGILAEDSQRRA